MAVCWADRGFATVQESITVQAFLESREAMLRLEDELGFREHFSQEAIDPLNRIGPDATDEDVYDTYLRHLRIGYDPTEGLIRMEVIAADPEVSQSYSQALIGFAEERVDRMSQRLRADQMSGAREKLRGRRGTGAGSATTRPQPAGTAWRSVDRG